VGTSIVVACYMLSSLLAYLLASYISAFSFYLFG